MNGGYLFKVFKNDHLPWIRKCGLRPYSDNPHIKRREFINDVGAYLEGVPMTYCENEYRRRVANQNRWRVAMIEDKSNFVHLGARSSFNPGGCQHPLIRFIRTLPYGSAVLEASLRKFVRVADYLAAKLMSR